MRRVRVLFNPRSGARTLSLELLRFFESQWSPLASDLTYQLSTTPDDGRRKARQAIADGMDTVIVVGGDGMVNTIGSELIGTPVALGVIPAGSGNGFARHFGIPLRWREAVAALTRAERCAIDVGAVNGHPFFVTCSLAWDAEVVKWFECSPVRGIFPYVMSAAYGFLEYKPQPFDVEFDDGERIRYEDPIVFTAANLTQFGGGARIAPTASAHDRRLELVVILRRDVMSVLPQLPRLFNGTLAHVPEVHTRSFRSLRITREHAAPVQIDGELLAPARVVNIEIIEPTLTVLVPAGNSVSRR